MPEPGNSLDARDRYVLEPIPTLFPVCGEAGLEAEDAAS